MASVFSTEVVEVVVAGVSVASAAAAGVVVAVRRRRAQAALRASIEAALGETLEAKAQLAQVSRDYQALTRAVRAQIDVDIAAQQRAIVLALAEVQRDLSAVVVAAPDAHVMTPGLRLVARQLETALATLQPGDDVSP